MEVKRNRPFYDILTHWQGEFDSVKHISPKYCAIAQLIMNDIENEVFKNGDRLPPHRHVADALDVSIQTISSAYRELEHQGYLHARVGQGSFVFKQVTRDTSKYIRDQREIGVTDFSVVRAVYSEQHDDYMAQAFSHFANVARNGMSYDFMRACRPVAGLVRQRDLISHYLKPKLPQVEANNTIITEGAAQGIFLALASIIRPDDLVVTEQLTDHGVIGCSRLLRYSLKGLEIDQFGIIPESFAEACQHESVKALVCTPNLNNPTSALMPLARRQQIADIAARYGVYIIEDDVYGNLIANPPATISSLLPQQSFYVSSLSKSVMTGMRIGYLVCPPQYHMRAESVLKVTSWMATPLMAEIFCHWIENGDINALIGLQRELVGERQRRVAKTLGPYIRHHMPDALSFWLALPEHWQPMAFTKRLYEKRIAVSTPDPFLVESSAYSNSVRVCIGANLSLEAFQQRLNDILGLLKNKPGISSAWV